MSDIDYTQWHYKVLFLYANHIEDELSAWGSFGWELASMTPEVVMALHQHPNPYLNHPPKYIVVLKQPYRVEQEENNNE